MKWLFQMQCFPTHILIACILSFFFSDNHILISTLVIASTVILTVLGTIIWFLYKRNACSSFTVFSTASQSPYNDGCALVVADEDADQLDWDFDTISISNTLTIISSARFSYISSHRTEAFMVFLILIFSCTHCEKILTFWFFFFFKAGFRQGRTVDLAQVFLSNFHLSKWNLYVQ